MKIIADEKIPFLDPLFNGKGSLITLPGKAISPAILRDADCLLVRTITPINAALLEGSSVQFVGTATAGVDHIDHRYLHHAGIAWSSAAGANAKAVRDYVLFAIANLRQQGLLQQKKLRAGVVGIGHVGRRVVALLKTLGFDVLENDPPRAKQESNFASTPLHAFVDLDLICLHTPLTHDGDFPTHNLIDAGFLSQQKPGCVLLNAGRGAVINAQDLKQASHIVSVLDVWDNEPNVDLDILQAARIATPHIAGYNQASKLRATRMVYHAFCEHFKLSPDNAFDSDLSLNQTVPIALKDPRWEERVLQVENLSTLSERLKKTQNFAQCRKEYVLRKELGIET